MRRRTPLVYVVLCCAIRDSSSLEDQSTCKHSSETVVHGQALLQQGLQPGPGGTMGARPTFWNNGFGQQGLQPSGTLGAKPTFWNNGVVLASIARRQEPNALDPVVSPSQGSVQDGQHSTAGFVPAGTASSSIGAQSLEQGAPQLATGPAPPFAVPMSSRRVGPNAAKWLGQAVGLEQASPDAATGLGASAAAPTASTERPIVHALPISATAPPLSTAASPAEVAAALDHNAARWREQAVGLEQAEPDASTRIEVSGAAPTASTATEKPIVHALPGSATVPALSSAASPLGVAAAHDHVVPNAGTAPAILSAGPPSGARPALDQLVQNSAKMPALSSVAAASGVEPTGVQVVTNSTIAPAILGAGPPSDVAAELDKVVPVSATGPANSSVAPASVLEPSMEQAVSNQTGSALSSAPPDAILAPTLEQGGLDSTASPAVSGVAPALGAAPWAEQGSQTSIQESVPASVAAALEPSILNDCPLPPGAIWCEVRLKNLPPYWMAAREKEDALSSTVCMMGYWEVDDLSDFGAPGHMLDIGANLGYYTMAFAHGGWKVTAFEPMLDNLALLNASLCRNPRLLPRVTINTIGLSTQPGECMVVSVTGNYGNGFVKCAHDPEAKGPTGPGVLAKGIPEGFALRNVFQVRRLDQVLAEQQITSVDAVKIDVEGYEYQVFAGAGDFLSRFHPRFIRTEVWATMVGASGADYLQFLADAGFAFFKDGRCQVPIEAFGESRRLGAMDVYACPMFDVPPTPSATNLLAPA